MFGSFEAALACACAALCVGAIAPASAAPLTLAEAIERTLASNPDLRVYAPRLRAARQHAEAAALRPPFELETEVQDAFGTGRASGFDSAETTVALSQVVELGNKRGLRVDAAGRRHGADRRRARGGRARRARRSHAALHPRGVGPRAPRGTRARDGACRRERRRRDGARSRRSRARRRAAPRARSRARARGVEQEHAEHELLSVAAPARRDVGRQRRDVRERRRRPLRAARRARATKRSSRVSRAAPTSRGSLPRNACATPSCAWPKPTPARISRCAPACACCTTPTTKRSCSA